ncbi:MAG: hypothetical protein JXA30_11075 [Deltaproteobacteria bacterium]|nr:hypothetical protein [Deltaproteobacteria bacterium]
MGRRGRIKIRSRFEPTRLAGDNLRLAYEVVVPVRRAAIANDETEQRLAKPQKQRFRQEQSR